jgi:hypothetical protein
MPDSPHPTIDIAEADLTDALERLARGRPLGGSPLVELRFVDLMIHDSGVQPSPATREWALSTVLGEVVQDHLAALREAGPRSAAAPGPPADLRLAPKPLRSAPRSTDLLGDERECLEGAA